MDNYIVQKEVFYLGLILIRLIPGFNATVILKQIFEYLEIEGFSEKFIFYTEHETDFQTFFRGSLHSFDNKPSEISKYRFGSVEKYHRHGIPHRDYKPARICFNTANFKTKKFYYINGKLHRENGLPALIDKDGQCKRWFLNGLPHRENDLPAVIDQKYNHGGVNGLCLGWLINGKYHRSNGKPSYISPKEMIFYNNGLIHRSDGPAIFSDDKVSYFINGKFISSMSLHEYKTEASEEDLHLIKSWELFRFCDEGFFLGAASTFLPTGKSLLDCLK